MIAYTPQIYEDELIYSYIARYYAHSGYMWFRSVAEEFMTAYSHPNQELINAYNADALRVLTRDCTLDTLIKEHTMYQWYAQFISSKKREIALDACRRGDCTTAFDALSMSRRREGKVMRYCPLCVREDRERCGEAYWHRVHQISELNICTKHHCYLVKTDISVCSKQSPNYISAEERVSDALSDLCGNGKEIMIADYVAAVFQKQIDEKNTVLIADYLVNQLQGTQYYSRRNIMRHLSLLIEDFFRFYEEVNINVSQCRIQRILCNQRFSAYEICLLGLFLGLSPDELTEKKIDASRGENLYDKEIRRLREQGLNYAQIARQMHASYDVVKSIGEGRY